jgi:hypothetical protein
MRGPGGTGKSQIKRKSKGKRQMAKIKSSATDVHGPEHFCHLPFVF